MQRTPEPELMDDAGQAAAYAHADFSEPNAAFLGHFAESFPEFETGSIVDLGCGPGDIVLRLARRYPRCRVTGIDGADAMLAIARQALAGERDLAMRVSFEQAMLPMGSPRRYDAVASNSLLHHLPDPAALWTTALAVGKPDAALLVMDLARPQDDAAARGIVEHYAGAEPDVLRRDFYNSLLAAFEPAEVAEQLRVAGLGALRVSMVSDRHWLVSGRLPA